MSLTRASSMRKWPLMGANGDSFDEGRNKYRTLTSAETKQLTKYLNSRQPARTASVLHKPRAPPLVVTDLDDNKTNQFAQPPPRPFRSSPPNAYNDATNGSNVVQDNSRRHSFRSEISSSCSYSNQRNSINRQNSLYGRIQSSVYQQANTNSPNKAQVSPDDSMSNLSFRSSLDVVDSAYGSDRLQTMSVDLGNPSQPHYHNDVNNGINKLKYYELDRNKPSEDSFSSAKSHLSECNKLKSTLSSSTSKVFQNQLFNLKNFFRNMPMRRSFVGSGTNNNNGDKKSAINSSHLKDKHSLEDSLTDICLNRSQSPPVCPPPPKQLQSMSYMESAVNYSNYDDFTRARNRQASTLLKHLKDNQRQANNNDNLRLPSADLTTDESETWQLTSLPVSFERNLTTVVEERQNLTDKSYSDLQSTFQRHQNISRPEVENRNWPINYQDAAQPNLMETSSTSSSQSQSQSQSLASITTADSILDFHRQNNSSFKFSYNQPIPHVPKKNSALPPRTPISETKQVNSLNNSLNGIYCDQHSEKILVNNNDQQHIERNSYTAATNGFDNDNDTTILSDTSTLNGDSNNIIYVNKCSELERTIESLKNKIITKEKELTDLQLKQWSSDYLTEQLKSKVNKLEKENAQLKAVISNYDRVDL